MAVNDTIFVTSTTSPETRLWRSVLSRLVEDATTPGAGRAREKARAEARQWLIEGGLDFYLVCDLAGFDGEALREALEPQIAEWVAEAAPPQDPSSSSSVGAAGRERIAHELRPQTAGRTGLFGHGATGKDLTAFQLAIAMISGAKWARTRCRARCVLYLPCEDDVSELRRRLDSITRHYKQQGCFKPRSDDLKIIPMIGASA